jgi:hypothetical protein
MVRLLTLAAMASGGLLAARRGRAAPSGPPDTAHGQAASAEASEEADSQVEQRWREGAELKDQLGEFQLAGERVRFRSLDRRIKLTVLENLALERVSRVIEESRTPAQWSVSGTITEFHGSNYLLITRAVVKARPIDDRS